MNLNTSFFNRLVVQRRLSAKLLILIFFISSPGFAAEPINDVRVLIDVSGSMKQNDPHNLRAPALRMLVRLLPQGSKAGVWTFGKYVNMQVKHGKVTPAWKKLAEKESRKIHSRGLFTNIEAALKRGSEGWEKPNRNENRHLILLTDGMVDVSKSDAEDYLSRKRILTELLPRLKENGVTVHTIALSKNSDKKLMSALAAVTDGWHESVDNAEDLQRVFLRIFEKTSNVDTVPLNENKFIIDKNIDDMTLLIFRDKDTPPTKLITPNNQSWTFNKHPAALTWYQDQGYDMISAKKPRPGEWIIKAAIDPDNRVMVVTNLKLKTAKLPNNLMYGDVLKLTASLEQDGIRITESKMLNLVKFEVIQVQKKPQLKSTEPLMDDGSGDDELAKDGVYSASVTANKASGDIEFIIRASSAAFNREAHHIIKVHKTPAEIKIVHKGENYKIELVPHMELLIPDSISTQLTLPDNSKQTFKQDTGGKWYTLVDKKFKGQTVTITLVGTRVNDKSFHADFERRLSIDKNAKGLVLSGKIANNKLVPTSSSADKTKLASGKSKQSDKDKPEKLSEKKSKAQKGKSEVDKEKQEEGFSWKLVIILIAVINGILLIGGGAGYYFWRKRKQKLAAESKSEDEMEL